MGMILKTSFTTFLRNLADESFEISSNCGFFWSGISSFCSFCPLYKAVQFWMILLENWTALSEGWQQNISGTLMFCSFCPLYKAVQFWMVLLENWTALSEGGQQTISETLMFCSFCPLYKAVQFWIILLEIGPPYTKGETCNFNILIVLPLR